MTKARITKEDGFRCAPEGHTVITIPKGADVEGRVAEWALSAHAASRLFDPRTDTQAETSAPEVKAPKKRGRPRKAGK